MNTITKTGKENKPKYKLGMYLERFTPPQKIAARKRMVEGARITRETLSRYINAKQGDQLEIPASTLKVFAEVLLVRMEDLFNS